MNSQKSSNFSEYFLNLGKLLIVHLVIFQMFAQPLAVLAQSRSALEISARPRRNVKSNVKAKVEARDFEGFLPGSEKKARRTFSDAFGVEVPLPQVFGAGGKLQALLAGASESPADKNEKLIEAASGSGKESNVAGKTKFEKSAVETAISINAPVLNSGSITGSLRVSKEIPFNLGKDFRITGNLYAAGSPDISTARDSAVQPVVNEESDDSLNHYRVNLNGGQIGGNIFIHSAAENIFAGIPLGLPKPDGSEAVEINSADDVKNIKDWKAVRTLTVNAANLTIPVPAGNYESITLNAASRLIFAGGDYNFSDTVNFQKGASVRIEGEAKIGIGRNLLVEESSIKIDEKISPEAVQINVLGSAVVLSGRSDIEGTLRAGGATVVVNENSKITGRVLAGSLVMNGGTIAESQQTGSRVFGLKQYTRTNGAPNVFTDNFARGVCQAPYALKIYNGNSSGGNRISSATVTMNGATVVAQNAFNQNVAYIERAVNLTAANSLEVRLSSSPGSFFNLEIVGTNCGGADTAAPVLTVASPQNNATTTSPAITVQGTATDNVAVAQVLVNNTQATYDAATKAWRLLNFPLAPGANQITVKAIDAAGNQAAQTVTVTRQAAVVDVTPPALTLSSPADNSTAQAQTITVTGRATDAEANASGLANVTVNGRNVNLSLNGDWTVSGVALNVGANTITARAADNAGNVSTKTIAVVRQESDTTAPTLSITAPGNNSQTTDETVEVAGTVSDAGGANPSGVASVTVNGRAAALSGSGWTIQGVSLSIGANTIVANAIDNAGNSSSRQISVTRAQADTTAPTVVVSSPVNNFETNNAAITVAGTATDSGANASGVESVSVGGQTAVLSGGGNWSIPDFALNVGANTIVVKARDAAGNQGTAAAVTVIRRAPDTQPPTVAIASPANNFQTTGETITVQGTVSDAGANASGVQSVVVGGTSAAVNGGAWTAANVSLNVGSNVITATARDNGGNASTASITVVRNPLDTTAPAITITSPVNNFETFASQIVVSGTATDTGAGATGVRGVTVSGIAANYNSADNSWTGTVNLADGVNQIIVAATDNAERPNQSQKSVSVTRIIVQPPVLTVTNPQNGAFLSTNSVTVAGAVSSNKPGMTFNVKVNGDAANTAGGEFTKVVNLTDGANILTVAATDALGQTVQQSITVTNDRTPPTVVLTNVPQIVNPGESYTIGAVASDAYGVADVEFAVNGASVSRSSASPYQFTLNTPLDQSPNQTLNISAIARDNAGLSATATARVVTSGPSGVTGYAFDDATGYVLAGAAARLNSQVSAATDENGLYSFVSTGSTGVILIGKQGYVPIERSYAATAGAGVEVFDARLTPLDAKINTTDVNGALDAADSSGKIQIQFAVNSFAGGADVRLTSVSPQGLANLLPFGWSPIPGAVADVRAASETGFSNRSFANPANLSVSQIAGLPANVSVVLARYNGASHNWVVVQRDLFASAGGTLQGNISASGQYAFLVADTGATAPPAAVTGEVLPASNPASSEQLGGATASAFAAPPTALYSSSAKSRITFAADSAAKLPSGVAIEASFTDSYLTIIDRALTYLERPSQDFVLYSFPSVSQSEPNKLGAYFVVKPVRTDFGASDLLNAKVHVDIRSGRTAQSGVLIGGTGGTVRGSEGSELQIAGGSVSGSQIVFFAKIPNSSAGVVLPQNYEMLGAFEINLAGGSLAQGAKISMPSLSGDNSKIVVAKVVAAGGQTGLKVVARAVENNSRLESAVSQPTVPSGVNLPGVRDGGKYVFVRMPEAFGYIRGTVSAASTQGAQTIKVTSAQTPFVDLTGGSASYTILGLANGESSQVTALSLNNDATGFGGATLAAQDAVANLPITLGSAVLSVQAVAPTGGTANVVVTSPVTITFNKPILSSTVTGSNVKLTTASGNPVISTITITAGARSIILTPSASLQSETDYRVKVSTGIRDVYGNALGSAFESAFRTSNATTAANQLQPAQIRIGYPNEQGIAVVSIPAGAIPVGSTVIAVNNSSGATVSTVAASGAIGLSLPARVGDEIELIIRQPDGAEYRVKQAAYRRADGFVLVGASGGTVTSEDGTLLLQIPAGAIGGQANIKMTFAPESSITAPRTGEMAPTEMNYIGGVKIETEGNFTNTQELHLELPAPAGAPENQRALVMKPAKINFNGTEIDSWETITSAKIEGGKIKSTSPPFFGVTLTGTLLSVSLLSFYIFIPARQRVVTGMVRKQKSDGTYQLVTEGECHIPSLTAGEPPPAHGLIQRDGKFTIPHNDVRFSSGSEVPVDCVAAGQPQRAFAFPYNGTEPGISGFETRFANVIYPADSLVNEPPQISIAGATLNFDGQAVPEESDPLKQYGKVQVGSNLSLSARLLPEAAAITSQQLIINGVSQNLGLQCQPNPPVNPQFKDCGTRLPTPVAGRYSVVIKARTVLANPLTEATKTFDFVVLANPNSRPPLAGANPAVVSVTPADGSSQIDVGSSIHIEFSEPVRNLIGAGNFGTIRLTEDEENGATIDGRILSGGLPVTTADAKSVVDFIPNTRLKSGKNYKLAVTTAVIDTSSEDADGLRHLDQNAAESGWQPFVSRFKTFQGTVITPTPINAQGYKIAVIDDYAITTTPNFNGLGSTVVAGGVEINSGNLAISESDAAVKGRGLSLDFTRSYNSQSADSFGTLGYGWRHSYQISLVHAPGGYTMEGGDGSGQEFKESKMVGGAMKAEAPYLGRLVKNADGSFDYFTKSQTKYHFRQPVEQGDPSLYLGNLDYIEEPNLNRIQLYYDSFGRLASVADASNRRLVFEYDAAENVFTGINVGDAIQGLQGCPKANQFRQITKRLEQSVSGKQWRIGRITGQNVGGLTIEYAYDAKGNLASVTRSGADSAISDSTDAREWQYTYNPTGVDENDKNWDEKYSHLLKTVKSPNNVKDAAAAVTEFKYFLNKTELPRVQQLSMPEGISNSFDYDYNAALNLVQSAGFTDGNGNRTDYQLESGRVKTISAASGAAVTRLEWTDFGQIKKTVDPEGKTTEIIFDGNNNPSAQTLTGASGEKIQTVTTFDAKFSKMTSFKDGNGRSTIYSVNQTTGNVDEITLPTGGTVLFHYFPNGDLKDATDQYGTRTEFSNYDGYGNPQAITKQLGAGQTQVITQTFDARSRQRSKSDNLGANATIDYDGLDRPTKQVSEDPTGYRNALVVEAVYLPEGQPNTIVQKDGNAVINRTKNLYDRLQRVKRTTETVSGYQGSFARDFTYDLNSNVKTEQNRRGVTVEKFYNALNHLTKIIQGGRTVWEATEVDKVGNPKTVKDLYGNQTVYVYDGLQRLKEKQLPENATEKLAYDANNNITDSFDRNNRKTHYTYDALNRVETLTDALGRVTRWTYADAEHTVEKENVSRGLREITTLDGLERPVSTEIKFGANNYRTKYEYDGRDATVTDARGTVAKQKMSGFGDLGETLVEGIDGQGTNYKVAMRYSALGGVNQVVDPLNRSTTFTNDGFNRRTSASFNGEFSESWKYDGEGLTTEHTDKRRVVSVFSYDELGRARQTVVKETVPTVKDIAARTINYLDEAGKEEIFDAKSNKTTLLYDGLRRVKQMTNADGKSKSFVYDGENLLRESDFYNDAQNRATRYVYDQLNRVREVFDRAGGHTTIDYSANDLTKTTTDRRGNAFTEEYDALGRLSASKDKLNNKIGSFTYDENGNRLTGQDGDGNETTFVYDKLNRLKSVARAGNLQTESYTYDAAGNPKTYADGRGGTIESLEYNALNQAKKVKDGAGYVSEFVYDGGGLLTSKKDAKQNQTTYKYNAFGSLVGVTEPGQPAWTLTYDDAQNLSSVRDPRSNTTGYEYDALNRLKKTVQPLGRTTEYGYDNNSNVTSVKDPKNQTATIVYTALDDVKTVSYNNEITHEFTYDAEQNARRIDENRTGGAARFYARDYDERNRLKQTTDASGKTVKFGYDAANNLKTLTDAANRVTTYSYDAKNQVDTVVQNGAAVADYDWYADGLLQKVAYQNGTTRNYGYDAADRVSNITNNFGGNQNESYDYDYDVNSNRKSEIRKENGVAKRTANYDYDALDRLKKADYTANVQTPNPVIGQTAQYIENSDFSTYGYDSVGNRINETNKTQSKTVTLTTDANGTSRSEQVTASPEQATTATFNELNELTRLNEPNGISNFTYDGNGNLSQISKNSTVISKYEYDVRNQLTKAKDGLDNELARFDYDFERKRISKMNSIGTTNYVYAGSQIVNETQNNANTASYTVGAGEIVKSEFAGGENNFHFTDALGSVTSLANGQGSLTNRNEYNAFGELSTSGNSSNSIGYTGQRLDTETGLMALGNGERYYSPQYARFIQQDSWLGDNAMPRSMNRFSYGYNNPFRFTDPSGNIADDNRGSLANSAREFGLNKNGDNGLLNIYLNWQARNAYDILDTISLGTLSRQEETVAQVEKGEITQEQFEKQTGYNAALGFAKVGLMIATAGAGNALTAGAGLTTRIGIGAGLGVTEQFGNDALEMGAGFRKDFSSTGTYALSAFTGGVFGAASPGKAATAYAKESKMTLGTELRFLKTEAKELGQSIGQRFNPRNYNFKLNENVLGSNGGGFELEFKPKTNVAKAEINWKAKEVNGRKVYQREDLFDPEKRSSWKSNDGEWKRGNNIERMKDGKSPMGTDGREVQLHHLTQTEINGFNGTRGSVAEVLTTFHQRFTRILHFPKPKIPRFSSFRKNLDGSRSTQSDEFDSFRNDYWKTRAEDFE